MAQTQNIFDIIYSGYTTPLEAQQLKAQVQIKQTEAQAGLLELQQQKTTMGVMQKIWGSPLGADAATGTDADKQKLQQTAAYLMQTGNVKDATSVLSRVASIDERQAMTQKDQMATETQRRQDLSATAGAVNDQATYSAAFPSIMEKLGPDAQKLKLTGVYEQDQKKLDFLSKSGATWAQKQQVAEAGQREQDNYMFKSIGASLAEQRLNDAKTRTDLLKKSADRADASQQERFREDAARDARLQAGVKGDPAKTYANNLKTDKLDITAAQDQFGLDPRTADMDPKLQSTYAEMAARRAKELMANEIRKDPKADVSYDQTLNTVMDQMDQEGLFKPTGSTWGGSPVYTYKAPSWGQGTPEKGTAAKPAAPAGTYTTQDQVKAAYKKGALTYDQAAELLKKNGWAQ